MTRALLTLLLAGGLLGCQHTAPRDSPAHGTRAVVAGTEESDDPEICDYDRVTGTHLDQWSCRRDSQAQLERERAFQFLTKPNMNRVGY